MLIFIDRNPVVVVVVPRGLLRMVAVMVSPFYVLALAGVSGDMMFLVCDDLAAFVQRMCADKIRTDNPRPCICALAVLLVVKTHYYT